MERKRLDSPHRRIVHCGGNTNPIRPISLYQDDSPDYSTPLANHQISIKTNICKPDKHTEASGQHKIGFHQPSRLHKKKLQSENIDAEYLQYSDITITDNGGKFQRYEDFSYGNNKHTSDNYNGHANIQNNQQFHVKQTSPKISVNMARVNR